MNNIDLKTYLPDIYNESVEMITHQDSLSIEMNKLATTYDNAMFDQFLQTVSQKALPYYETMFNIVANPSQETIKFRRERLLSRVQATQPPYTYYYMRMFLDKRFGKGNYEFAIDNENYLITLESSVKDSKWYHEIMVAMNRTKPCNLIFVNKPRIDTNLLLNEEVEKSTATWNYRLNGTWYLGIRPFLSKDEGEIIKMAETQSVQDSLIQFNLEKMLEKITKIKINDDETITYSNLNKQVDTENNVLNIKYLLDERDTQLEVTNIKLLDSNNTVLCSSDVYVPIAPYTSLELKHKLKLQEIE